MTCTIRATVATGLEFLAVEEVQEKLEAVKVEQGRGFVSWQQDIHTVKDVCISC